MSMIRKHIDSRREELDNSIGKTEQNRNPSYMYVHVRNEESSNNKEFEITIEGNSDSIQGYSKAPTYTHV